MKVQNIPSSLHILGLVIAEWHRVTVVELALHHVNVPVGVQQGQVDNSDVRPVAFYLLNIPYWEGVIVTIGEEDGVRLARVQVHFSHLTCHIAIAAVMVIPVLCNHDGRNQQSDASDSPGGCFAAHFAQHLIESNYP